MRPEGYHAFMQLLDGVVQRRAPIFRAGKAYWSRDKASLKGPDLLRCCQAHRQSPSPHQLRKHTRSQGPSLHQHYPASTVLRPCPTPARAAASRDVEAATLTQDGSPPITRITFPTCRAHCGSSGCACRLLPRSCSLPHGRRVGIRIVTFEACSGFTRVTAHRIPQPPKATFVTSAFGAHCHYRTSASCRTRRLGALAGICRRVTVAARLTLRGPDGWAP
jgi:hypothetical protein